MLVPPLAGRTVKHLVDVPLDCQQIIDLPLLLLALGVPGVLLGKQGLDFRRQRLGAACCASSLIPRQLAAGSLISSTRGKSR